MDKKITASIISVAVSESATYHTQSLYISMHLLCLTSVLLKTTDNTRNEFYQVWVFQCCTEQADLCMNALTYFYFCFAQVFLINLGLKLFWIINLNHIL